MPILTQALYTDAWIILSIRKPHIILNTYAIHAVVFVEFFREEHSTAIRQPYEMKVLCFQQDFLCDIVSYHHF
jgi:hypothetical protein